jgi:Protein of unknown function (DUF1569)
MKTLAHAAVLNDLLDRFQRLTPDAQRVWGTMNAQQMAVHVGDASAACLKQRPFSATTRKPMPLFKFIALRVIPQFPRDYRSGAEPAKTVVDPAKFASDRDRAIMLLQKLAATPAEGLALDHPRFGTMTRIEWMRWAYMHTDHHLRQFGL